MVPPTIMLSFGVIHSHTGPHGHIDTQLQCHTHTPTLSSLTFSHCSLEEALGRSVSPRSA